HFDWITVANVGRVDHVVRTDLVTLVEHGERRLLALSAAHCLRHRCVQAGKGPTWRVEPDDFLCYRACRCLFVAKHVKPRRTDCERIFAARARGCRPMDLALCGPCFALR